MQAAQLLRLLESHGYGVRTALSGAAALEALSVSLPALILSDVLLTDMDGYELCRMVKGDPRFRQVPVLLLMSVSEASDIIAGLQCGADSFVVKPWDKESILSRIERLVAPQAADASGVPVTFQGQKHLIHGDRAPMLDLLLASYEAVAEQAAELRKAKEEAERANRAKTELLARLAHEMRTPLNAILGFGQLLQHGGSRAEDAESARHVIEAGKHLIRLTHEMIDLSRIDTGVMSLSCNPIAWEEVVEKCLENIQPLADKRRLHIRWESHGAKGCPVIANRERLGEVVWSLLSNAVKYNHEGGDVVVSDERCLDGKVRISVSDTGSGIAEMDLPLLFVPFERLGAEKRGIQGSGLGLALARKLAEVMGGSVGVKSVKGAGSTFWIDLPSTGRAASAAGMGSGK